jgi:spore maturation protein CgeB
LDGLSKVFSVKALDYRKHKNESALGNDIFSLVTTFKPDIIFINKGETIPALLIKRINDLYGNIKIYLFNGDQRGKIQQEVLNIGKLCDAILINNNDMNQWNQYYKFGIRKIVEYHTASNVNVFKNLGNINPKYDFVFVGGEYGNSFPLSKFRYNVVKELSLRFNVAVAGNINWNKLKSIKFVDKKYDNDFVNFVNDSKFIIGISAFDKIRNYTSNRTWNSMACGIPFFCHRYEGIDSFFKNMDNIIIFDNLEHCLELAETIVKDYDKYKFIGYNGMKLIRLTHTYVNRANQLLEIYNEDING